MGSPLAQYSKLDVQGGGGKDFRSIYFISGEIAQIINNSKYVILVWHVYNSNYVNLKKKWWCILLKVIYTFSIFNRHIAIFNTFQG